MTNEEHTLPDCGDSLDKATFDQILEMDDDDEDREFSRSIVFGFFEQAETTFEEIETNIESKNMLKLSELGHFLKGSSATLGLTIIKNGCEKIQHLGKGLDEKGDLPQAEDACLKQITEELKKIRDDYVIVEAALKHFFGEG